MSTHIHQPLEVAHYLLRGDDQFPNNPQYPVLVYKGALQLPLRKAASMVEDIFNENGWENSWKNGIYDYHHYHSTSHEVLGVSRGYCRVQLGGEHGIIVELIKGDVILIPAGVAHKNLAASPNFKCVGAYPEGQDYDINYGTPEERPKADLNIEKVPMPETDPLYGKEGPLMKYWKVNAVLA